MARQPGTPPLNLSDRQYKLWGNFMAYMLTPPSRAIFIVSVVFALIAVLVQFFHAQIPMAMGHAFVTLLIAYILLLVGNLVHGL